VLSAMTARKYRHKGDLSFMKLFLIALFILTNAFSLYAQIDPVDQVGFEITRKTPYAVLPDSLGATLVKGFAVVEIGLDARGRIKNFKLLKLKLVGSKKIDYFFGKKLTNKVERYIPFLQQYVEKLKFKKNSLLKLPDTSYLSFIIRFK
jgi:hypothetical protein